MRGKEREISRLAEPKGKKNRQRGGDRKRGRGRGRSEGTPSGERGSAVQNAAALGSHLLPLGRPWRALSGTAGRFDWSHKTSLSSPEKEAEHGQARTPRELLPSS